MNAKEHVSVSSKLWLCSADCLCGTLSGLITGGGMTYFYTKYMGLEEHLASIVWIIFAVWNALNDPLFGYLSDRTKSKLGRRIPYIRYGALFYGVIFIMSWFMWPFGGSQTALFVQMLVSLFFFDTFYTAIATALYVLPYTMAESNQARSSIFIWKIFSSLLSLGAPLVLFPLVRPDVGESAARFQMIMTVLGIVTILVIYCSTFFYKEKFTSDVKEAPGLWESICQCFKNRAFLVYEVISFTVIFVQTILMQGVIYYFDEFQISMPIVYGCLGLGAVCGIILWMKSMDKIGIAKCIIVMSIAFAAGATLMIFAGQFLVTAMISFFIVGTGFSGCMYLVPLMNGEVIDYDEMKTGFRREGMYAGVNSLVTKPAISFANAAFVTIIGLFGYDNALKAGEQAGMAKFGVKVAWMALPALLFILSALAMKAYPLFGEEWKRMKEDLTRKHKEQVKAPFK